MLSYKNWKLLEESFGFSNLGIKTPQNIGSVGNLAGLDEASKKMKKKMLEDDAVPTDEVPDEGTEEEEDEGEETESEPKDCGCDDKKMCCKGMKKKMKKEACEEDDEEEEEDEDQEIEDAEEEAGEDLDGDDEEGEDPDHVAKVKGKTLDMPLMGMKKKMKKKMKKEHQDHVNSIKEMLASDPQHKNWDGISVKQEDYLIQSTENQPGPGEPGYAPQTRFGVGANVQEEWKKIAKDLGC